MLRRLTRLALLAVGMGYALVVLSALFAVAVAPAAPRGAAIVVLGAGGDADGTLGPAAQARVAQGVALWKAGAAPLLVMSDGAAVAAEMAAAARAAGVPPAQVRIDGNARSTLQNALNTRAIMDAAGADAAILVTEGFHMARARASFAWAGVPVSGYALSGVLRPGIRGAVGMTLREALAWPFNIARVLVWHAGALFGYDEGDRFRWLA